MAHLTEAEGKRIIEDVASENGWMSSEEIDYLRQERPAILKKYMNIRQKLGISIKT
jgi:hypothetical protein